MPWDKEASIKYLQTKMKPPPPWGNKGCATAVREALEAGGLKVSRTIGNGWAKNYGPRLTAVGFESRGFMKGAYETGDIALIDGFTKDEKKGIPRDYLEGHVCMWTGSEWISDFKQPDATHPYPGSNYKKALPSVVIYRYKGD
jgi:type VI secretion system secreted protein VgrG